MNFINKGLSIVHKLNVQCDSLKLICLGINCSGIIVYILYKINVFVSPMLVQYVVFDVKFLVSADFFMKGFCSNIFQTMHSMLVLGKSAQS